MDPQNCHFFDVFRPGGVMVWSGHGPRYASSMSLVSFTSTMACSLLMEHPVNCPGSEFAPRSELKSYEGCCSGIVWIPQGGLVPSYSIYRYTLHILLNPIGYIISQDSINLILFSLYPHYIPIISPWYWGCMHCQCIVRRNGDNLRCRLRMLQFNPWDCSSSYNWNWHELTEYKTIVIGCFPTYGDHYHGYISYTQNSTRFTPKKPTHLGLFWWAFSQATSMAGADREPRRNSLSCDLRAEHLWTPATLPQRTAQFAVSLRSQNAAIWCPFAHFFEQIYSW